MSHMYFLKCINHYSWWMKVDGKFRHTSSYIPFLLMPKCLRRINTNILNQHQLLAWLYTLMKCIPWKSLATIFLIGWFRNHHCFARRLFIIQKEPPVCFKWWFTSRVYVICRYSTKYTRQSQVGLKSNKRVALQDNGVLFV